MILVDTSVWVNHLRHGDDELAALLRAGEVACHTFVTGELACGNIRNRAELLALLSTLPHLPKAEDAEVIEFIGQHRLMGKGLGLIDIHLLASCVIAGIGLWTRDGKLRQAASIVGLAHEPK